MVTTVCRQTMNRARPSVGACVGTAGPGSKGSFMSEAVDFKIHTGPSPPQEWKRNKQCFPLAFPWNTQYEHEECLRINNPNQ